MKVYGNANLLKKEIEKTYSTHIQQVQSERAQIVGKLKSESKEKLDVLKAQLTSHAQHEGKIAYEQAFNEKFSVSRRDFEYAREALYNDVFESILKDVSAVCKKKEFADWVAHFVAGFGKKKVKVRCHPSAKAQLSKKISGTVTADKEIMGARVTIDGADYDLTIPTLLETKKDSLRRVIAEQLM